MYSWIKKRKKIERVTERERDFYSLFRSHTRSVIVELLGVEPRSGQGHQDAFYMLIFTWIFEQFIGVKQTCKTTLSALSRYCIAALQKPALHYDVCGVNPAERGVNQTLLGTYN